MQKILKVEFADDDKDKKFPFISLGDNKNNNFNERVWLSTKLLYEINGNYFVEFPIRNTKIITTEKSNHVIKPERGFITHYLHIPCGFRGASNIEILYEVSNIVYFADLSFPEGDTGISTGCIVNKPLYRPLKYKYIRSGELYGGKNKGIRAVRHDGSEEELAL